jgi:small subunit ribosomal protein S8
MLTRIRNASRAGHDQVLIPASRAKLEIARLLRAEGYIQKCELLDDRKQGTLRVTLRYVGQRRQPAIQGIKRVSKSGLRLYVGKRSIPRVVGGMGTAIMTTSSGLMADREARSKGLGGEVICFVW